MTLRLTTSVDVNGTLSKTAGLNVSSEDIKDKTSGGFSDGTAANQANEYWSESIVSQTGIVTRNMEDGSLFNSQGDPLTLTSMKMYKIVNLSQVPGEVIMLSGSALPVTGTTPITRIDPGGVEYWESPIDGQPIVGVTADEIILDFGLNTFDAEISVAGIT